MPKQTKALEELKQTRDHTLLDIERLRAELQAEIEPASATDDDSADIAADIYERGKIISLIQSLEAKLHSLERAIALASKGTYGICEMCGEPIPPERLKVMPETTVCVRCASKLEEGIRRRRILISGQEEDADSLFYDEDEEQSEDSSQAEDEF
jgi:RNA polymerase-binding transcription factor DksA